MSKNMPKQLRAAWKNVTEAGDFVELQTMGGIIRFDTNHDDEPANSLTADFRNFRIFSYSLGRV